MSPTTYGTDDGFRRAMANANRMRLRSLGAATCATALVVALTGTLVPASHTSGESRLEMVTTPVTPRPGWTQVPEADPYVLPAGATEARPEPAAGATHPGGRVAERNERDAEATTTRPARRKPQSSGMTRSIVGLVPDVGCAFQAAGWCFKNPSGVPEHPAHSRTLEVDLCNAAVGEYQLQFDSSAEVEMTVQDSRGRVLWSWLAEHPAKKQPHYVRYAAGTPCLRWKVKWYERTNDGVALGPGRYRFVARLLARNPSGIPASVTEFTL